MATSKKPTKKIIQAAIIKHNGFVVNAADELKVNRNTLSKWIKQDESLQATVSEARESMKDKAEAQLLKNILDGKETSLIFYLKCIAKDRGYSQDVEGQIAATFNQLNISVQSEEAKIMINDIVKKISNE